MDVNEAYELWRTAEEQDKGEAQTLLWKAVEQRACRILGRRATEQEPALAGDIATDVILGLDRFRGNAQFSTWVERIARNKRADHKNETGRKRERFVQLPRSFIGDGTREDDWYSEAGPKNAVGDREAEMQAHLEVMELEGRISPEDRPLYEALFVEGRTHREAAELLGKTVDAVESASRRLKANLRQNVK